MAVGAGGGEMGATAAGDGWAVTVDGSGTAAVRSVDWPAAAPACAPGSWFVGSVASCVGTTLGGDSVAGFTAWAGVPAFNSIVYVRVPGVTADDPPPDPQRVDPIAQARDGRRQRQDVDRQIVATELGDLRHVGDALERYTKLFAWLP